MFFENNFSVVRPELNEYSIMIDASNPKTRNRGNSEWNRSWNEKSKRAFTRNSARNRPILRCFWRFFRWKPRGNHCGTSSVVFGPPLVRGRRDIGIGWLGLRHRNSTNALQIPDPEVLSSGGAKDWTSRK